MRNTRVNSSKKCHSSGCNGVLRHIKNALSRDKLGETLVLHGHISPYDLKKALKLQKKTQKPLGQIFIEQSRITPFQLAKILFRQRLVRFTAASMLFFASFGSFTKKSQAGSIKDVPARIALAMTDTKTVIQNVTSYPELFGAKEKRSTNLKAFTKWTKMFERFDKSLDSSEAKPVIQKLKAELEEIDTSSIHKMAKQVNAIMNEKKYILDNKNWGKSDYWATPIEFMERGGDCEDFAIAKYAALRALGVPEDRMRLAIVQDQKKNMPHAVLIVYAEDGIAILDNQNKKMLYSDEVAHYKPIFSINRHAWWLHTTKDKPTTIVASAE